MTRESSERPLNAQAGALLNRFAWNKKVKRTIESLGGSLDLYRPYFYCKNCHQGFYPLDEALGLASSTKQHDIQDLEAWLSSELPFETASEAFRRCTGDTLSADHMFETTNHIANHFDILDFCPTRNEIEQKIDGLSRGKFRRPVMMIAIDGARAPTRPEPSPWKGKRGKGEWKEAKGFRVYLIDSDTRPYYLCKTLQRTIVLIMIIMPNIFRDLQQRFFDHLSHMVLNIAVKLKSS